MVQQQLNCHNNLNHFSMSSLFVVKIELLLHHLFQIQCKSCKNLQTPSRSKRCMAHVTRVERNKEEKKGRKVMYGKKGCHPYQNFVYAVFDCYPFVHSGCDDDMGLRVYHHSCGNKKDGNKLVGRGEKGKETKAS